MESNSLVFSKVKGTILLAKVFLFIHEILTLESTIPLGERISRYSQPCLHPVNSPSQLQIRPSRPLQLQIARSLARSGGTSYLILFPLLFPSSSPPPYTIPTSQILPQELNHSLIAPLILSTNVIVFEVRARRHPAVDLVAEGLNVLGAGERGLVLLNVLSVLVLRREQAKGHLDFGRLGRVHHRGVHLDAGLEGVLRRRGHEGDYLAAPAELWQ